MNPMMRASVLRPKRPAKDFMLKAIRKACYILRDSSRAQLVSDGQRPPQTSLAGGVLCYYPTTCGTCNPSLCFTPPFENKANRLVPNKSYELVSLTSAVPVKCPVRRDLQPTPGAPPRGDALHGLRRTGSTGRRPGEAGESRAHIRHRGSCGSNGTSSDRCPTCGANCGCAS